LDAGQIAHRNLSKKECYMPSWNPKDIARSDQAAATEMTARGITRVAVDYFHYKEFRYTTLADAIAQADRDSVPKP
jgi:hypothetical protein